MTTFVKTRAGAGTPVTVETVADPAAFLDLREEWTALLADSDADNVFLTWEWLHTWWRHLRGSRRLTLYAVRRHGQLIALAPFAATPGWRVNRVPLTSLAFLGTGTVGSDYLDVIVARGREVDACEALSRSLDEQGLSLVLTQLGPASAAANLAARLARRGWQRVERSTDVCPYIPLEGLTWASYLASVSGHHRSNVRRRLAHLERSGQMEFDLARTEAERAAALGAFFDLHGRRWDRRGGSSAVHSAEVRAFHESWTRLALAQGWLRLFTMRLAGRPVASLYALRYRDVFAFYQIGFDPAHARQGVGQVTVGLAIKHALGEGAREFDFLHGDEPYKFDWTRHVRGLSRIEAYPPTPRGRVQARLTAMSALARRVARMVLAGRPAPSARSGQ